MCFSKAIYIKHTFSFTGFMPSFSTFNFLNKRIKNNENTHQKRENPQEKNTHY